jgi:localization factor PodJL
VELSNRLQHTESTLQSGMPEQLRREFGQLVERIDSVKASADQMARQAQTAATGIARSELREIETRVLATLKETQAAAGAPGAAAPEFGQIRGEIGGLARRMDEIKANSATERDLHALRLAVEHLSSRVAQVPDVRPLADMDRRLAELGQKVEQTIRQLGDPRAIETLEQNIATVGERVSRTEEQLRHIETMEQAIRQLYGSLEQSRELTSQTAEEAASRTVERMLSSGTPGGRSPELKALEDGLRAVRESAAGAERRNQDTLAAVHETLSQIVEKIAEIEAGPAGPAMSSPVAARALRAEPAAPPAQQTPDIHQPPPAYKAEPGPARPAQHRPRGMISSPPRAGLPRLRHRAPPPCGRNSAPWLRRPRKRAACRSSGGSTSARSLMRQALRAQPMGKAAKDQGSAARRRRLLLAGVVLLAAVSAFAFNMLVRTPAPPAPPSVIEVPDQQQPERPPERQGLLDLPADFIVTGALPSPVAANPVRLPPPETGTPALRSAAANGDAAAQFIVASRYFDGDGVARDAAKAAFWYEQAAESGLAPAQYRLGTLYERGSGVAQDAGLALSWYERAARQGNVKSMHNAAVISIGGQAGPADHGRALALFSAAAERGLRDSQFNLAILHERGLGTREDKAEAVFWYRLAALQGDSDAAERAAALSRPWALKCSRVLRRACPPGRRSPATTPPMSWRSSILPGRNRPLPFFSPPPLFRSPRRRRMLNWWRRPSSCCSRSVSTSARRTAGWAAAPLPRSASSSSSPASKSRARSRPRCWTRCANRPGDPARLSSAARQARLRA